MADRRKQVLQKLGEVSRRIEGILAGQDATLGDMVPLELRQPGETPLERLQRFKALLNEVLRELAAGEARRCDICGGELAAVELDEMPWASRCRACAGGGQ